MPQETATLAPAHATAGGATREPGTTGRGETPQGTPTLTRIPFQPGDRVTTPATRGAVLVTLVGTVVPWPIGHAPEYGPAQVWRRVRFDSGPVADVPAAALALMPPTLPTD